jgi:DNA segregation ATPase FtsK/SpoIIIE-like protein
MRDILDRQADHIEYILSTHGIKAGVDGGKLSPRLAHFRVSLPQGVRATTIAPIVQEIAGELGVTSCRMTHGEEGVYLEVPRPDPIPVRLLQIVQRVADVVPPVTVTLGPDSDGTPLLLRLNSPDVDPLLIVGDQGAGKSSLLGGMALSLALHNSPDRLRLLLIDGTGEGRAFPGLERLPHLACPVANGPVDAMLSLRWALRTLARHARANDPLGLEDEEEDELFFGDEESVLEPYAPQKETPSLVVLIDGADLLCGSGNRRTATEAMAALNKLLHGGSRNNIHIAMSVESLPMIDALEADWGARIVGRVHSPEAARQATGIKSTGAHSLLGAGDFLISLNTELIRFQAPGVSSSEIAKSVDLIITCAQMQSQPEARTEYDEFDLPAMPTVPTVPSRRPERAQHVMQEPVPLRRSWIGE